jgi:hypothetical protein
MRPEFKWTFRPVREWLCFVPKCRARTKDWNADGWFVTGYQTHWHFTHANRWTEKTREEKTIPRETYEETDFARDELVRSGKIEESSWCCAYICPSHKGEVIGSLADDH